MGGAGVPEWKGELNMGKGEESRVGLNSGSERGI